MNPTVLVFRGMRGFAARVFRSGCRWMTLGALVLVGFLSVSLPVNAAEAVVLSRVFVVLEGEPLAAREGLRAGTSDWEAARIEMQSDHERVRVAVEGLGGHVLKSWTLLNHAVFVEVPTTRVEELGRVPGVRVVVPERHHSRLLQTSVPAVGGPAAWAGSPAMTGRGVRIGIIDSGIDYLHGDFGGKGSVVAYGANDPKVIEPGTFPTSKVVGGIDLVGDDYDSSNSSTSLPQPDPDPLDPVGNGHGSHVAGIAAGLGVPRGGTNYAGPYDLTLPTRTWRVSPGVAPEALLYAIKVFGRGGTTSSSTIVDALNRAADPDGNGDPVDRLDVVNLSLGSTFGTDDGFDPEVAAVKTLSGLGCVVVVSAGNEGNAAFKISSPASGSAAIAVANAYDAGYATGAIAVEGAASVAGLMAAVEGVFTPPLAGMNPVRGTVVGVIPNLACDPVQNATDLSGRIALVDRGVCYFVDKVRALQAAGAIGVVVVNNVDGPPIVMGGTGDLSGFRIPAVMISRADGDRLKAALSAGVVVTLSADVGIPFPEYADSIHESSSRGPVWPTVRLKPDLSAPGASIDSAKAGSGLNPVAMTGTSMAAPHVAGAAALLRQAHRDWTASEIKAALMNTAMTPQRSVSGAPTPESRAGAGRLQVDAALKATVLVRSEGAPESVSLSFGMIHASNWMTRTQVVSVLNKGKVPVTCRVASSNTLDQPGVVLRPRVSSITVPAQGVGRFEVVLEVDPARWVPDADHASSATSLGRVRQGLPEASGQLWVLGGGVDVHVPWHAVVRVVGDFRARAGLAGVPAGDPVVMPMPTMGGATRTGWVGVFQPGYNQTVPVQSGTAAATDVVATGAMSDFATAGSVPGTTVSIAVVMAGPWVTPMRRFTRVDVEVDRDGNGTVDAVLAAADTGLVTANDLTKTEQSTDGFVPVLDARNGAALVATGDWNGFTPDRGDPAAFANGVMVLSARGSDLGLTAARPAFRYRVRTDGSYSDMTPWVMFDPTRPWVDGAAAGRPGGIWQEEGLGVTGRILRSNAIYNGVWLTDRAGVLLVHLHGAPGRQAETVQVHLGVTDTDGDGLPDGWELGALGDLEGTMKTDRDGDGFTDGDEWSMGTDPRVWDGLIGARRGGDGLVLEWSGTTGRRYTVWRSSTLGGSHEVWRTGLLGRGQRDELTDADVGAVARFYRLVVEPR